ncbi:hypothetical protein JQC72_11465 [Polycladomyces sp. WAk]|uniref:Uncharacterized protein n=1 Tax=Polycladomyces zharkentensis TaxID=2807616 RepID=A0ABS2WKR3_9BACL|nr:hypothetical protein [Polycladomyces sp. WAk]MBN2910119.1 hypothetical protein [Polycladomyces sp. WAk]
MAKPPHGLFKANRKGSRNVKVNLKLERRDVEARDAYIGISGISKETTCDIQHFFGRRQCGGTGPKPGQCGMAEQTDNPAQHISDHMNNNLTN